MNDKFGKDIKHCLHNSLDNLDVPQNMFQNAWDQKVKIENKEKYFMKKNINKFIAAATLCFALLGGALVTSPVARAAVKSFFDLDNKGNIVEKKDEDTTYVNCSINLTDDNQKYIEELLGFKIKQPDNIGKYSLATLKPVPGLSIKNVKFKDENKISDEIKKSTDYKTTIETLKKDHDVYTYLLSMYSHPDGADDIKIFSVVQSKNQYKDTIDKSIKIEGFECSICSSKTPDYKKKVSRNSEGLIDGIQSIDSEKPNGVSVTKSICFSYKGINYKINGDDPSTIDDETIKFTEEYIKYLKSAN